MADRLTPEAVRAALVAELGAALEAGLNVPVTLATAAAAGGAGWLVTVRVDGALTGELTAWIDAAGAGRAARRLMNIDDEPEPSVVAEMLKEMWSHAARMAVSRWPEGTLQATVEAPAAGEAPADAAAGWTVAAGDTALAVVSVRGTLHHAASATGPRVESDVAGNLAVLMDIDLPLVVRFARTELTLKALTALGPGSMLDMGRAPEDPVQVLVGGQVVAEGDVVVVAGNYGVRVTSVLGPVDRLRALEGTR
ncbi:MAG: FliM/FliN family flagellar motor switch protein [Vicinamibacterales bacterium]